MRLVVDPVESLPARSPRAVDADRAVQAGGRAGGLPGVTFDGTEKRPKELRFRSLRHQMQAPVSSLSIS
jgi:hypothetical protein